MKKSINKLLGIVAIVILLVSVGVLSVDFFVEKYITEIIEKQNNKEYHLEYEEIDFSLLKGGVVLKKVQIKPNVGYSKSVKILGNLNTLSIVGVNFYQLLKNKNLKASEILIENPDITLLQTSKKPEEQQKKVKFESLINVDRIKIKNGLFSVKSEKTGKLLYKVSQFNGDLSGISFGEETARRAIPFTYKKGGGKADSVYIILSPSQVLTSKNIDISDDKISVKRIKISSARHQAVFSEIGLTGFDWGYDDDENLYVKGKKLLAKEIDLNLLFSNNKSNHSTNQRENSMLIDLDSLEIKKINLMSDIIKVKDAVISAKGMSKHMDNPLIIKEIKLKNPYITHTPIEKTKKIASNPAPQKNQNEINIHHLSINNARYDLKNRQGKKEIEVKSLDLSLQDMIVDDNTRENSVFFKYKNPKILAKNMRVDKGNTYLLTSDQFILNSSDMRLTNFKMNPKITKEQHQKQHKWSVDYYYVSVPQLDIRGYNLDENLSFRAKNIILNQPVIDIFADVSKPNEPKENGFYSKKLRNIDFDFFVHHFHLKNASLVYKETENISKAPGNLIFTKLNLWADNLYTGKNACNERTNIKVKSVFMKDSNVDIDWSFRIKDPQDRFNIKGTIDNFDALSMSPFLTPYLRIQVNGNIKHTAFNFSGNNNTANGTFAMSYEGLKVSFLKKDHSEKKFLSALGNLVIRNNTKGMKKVQTKPVDRHKDKSFFNFLWLNLAQGLKQVIL